MNDIVQPSWFYKPVQIDSLETIQHELNNSLDKLIPTKQDITFYYIERSILESVSPSYVKMISDLNLLDRWIYSAIVTTEGQDFPIHIDSTEWKRCCFGLNIPILNCEDSWTVWYDAEIDQSPEFNEYDVRKSARRCLSENAIELCRMPASIPAWVNISIPHRPVTTHNKLRAVISARFMPELHDYFN